MVVPNTVHSAAALARDVNFNERLYFMKLISGIACTVIKLLLDYNCNLLLYGTALTKLSTL
jgi:hypothetical protein